MPVRTTFLQPEPADEYFDSLGREAATLVADLLPGALVELKYISSSSGESVNTSDLVTSASNAQHLVAVASAGRVPNTSWWRGFTVLIPRDLAHFIGDNVATETVSAASAICRDVADAWASVDAPSALGEIQRALAAEYRRWAVAHLIAERIFEFAAYGDDEAPAHDQLAHTVASVLDYFEELAATRVEHQQLSMGVVISGIGLSPQEGESFPGVFRRMKRTPLLADGHGAVLEIDSKGTAVAVLTRDDLVTAQTDPAIAKMNLLPLAAIARHGIGLQLRTDGSVAAYTRKPLLVRRGGRWRGLMWKEIADVLISRHGDVGARVFDAALRLSSAGHGGIFALLHEIPTGIHEKDLLESARSTRLESHPEWAFHRLLKSTIVAEMSAEYLATLASIDGATLISNTGVLLAYGAVVPSKPAGAEGARSAAARSLSDHGLVIKVSADGPIAIYEDGAERIQC